MQRSPYIKYIEDTDEDINISNSYIIVTFGYFVAIIKNTGKKWVLEKIEIDQHKDKQHIELFEKLNLLKKTPWKI